MTVTSKVYTTTDALLLICYLPFIPLVKNTRFCFFFLWSSFADLISGAGKLLPAVKIQSSSCFCTACKVRMMFTFLNVWRKKNVWLEIQISVPIHKILLEHNHAHSLTYHVWLTSVLQWQSWVAAKPKIFTIWPFIKFADSWSNTINSLILLLHTYKKTFNFTTDLL